MSERTVEITRFEKVGSAIYLEWIENGHVYERVVTASKINSPEKMAAWLREQPVDPVDPQPSQIGKYTIVFDDQSGDLVSVNRDTRVDVLLGQIEARQAQIVVDQAALPGAGTVEIKQIIGRQLNAETHILDALDGIIRLLRRLQ